MATRSPVPMSVAMMEIGPLLEDSTVRLVLLLKVASLAYGAHQEVGHGGHFLGAEHTLERFRTCFYRPLLSSTDNFERWKKRGGLDATARASEIWRSTLDEYQQPPLDDPVRERLKEYVDRRRIELGD